MPLRYNLTTVLQAVGRVLSSDSVTIEGSDLMVSIPALDDEGNPLPDWKLRVLHRKAADKAQKIAEIKATVRQQTV
jgi:hypothetical protein